ncbi:MAG: hypothetical protein ACTSV2_05005 [Candidatus Thorarchaeota archaeon]
MYHEKFMVRKRQKKKEKRSPLGSSIPPRITIPVMYTRYMMDIDRYARRKKKKKPRALRHPHN